MPLENQISSPEKTSNSKGFESVEAPQANQEAQELLSSSDSFNNATSGTSDNLSGVLPDSDNILNTGDQETREAFGLEGKDGSSQVDGDGQPIDKSSENGKDAGDIKDGKVDAAENPKSEQAPDQANAHDATEVDQQEGESASDNKDVASHKDGKDKKGKTGDADKDTDDGDDSKAGETIADAAKPGQPGAESSSMGTEVSSGDDKKESESKDSSLNKSGEEKADADSEAFGNDADTSKQPSMQPPPLAVTDADQSNTNATENITRSAGQENGTDLYANAMAPILNETAQQSIGGENSGNGSDANGGQMDDSSKHPSIEPSQMQSTGIDQSTAELTENISRAAGQDSSMGDNPGKLNGPNQENSIDESTTKAAQATIDSGLNYSSTQALYERSVSLR